MGMENSGMSVADVMALQDRNNNGMFGGGDGAWVFFLFFLLAWGGNGFGGFGNNAQATYATQADIQRGFDQNTVINKLDGLSQGLCQVGYENLNMGNQIQSAIANLGFQSQQCCCETNRNIDAVRYENARNTCDIVNAIKADGDATRALITQNTIQDLRDQLQSAHLQLSNSAQTSALIDQLRPCARPAYLTCSPYTSMGNYGNCGCGNGCC